jgi:hypothetical protein
MLFIAGLSFLVGAIAGSNPLLMIMTLRTGMVEDIWKPFVTTMIIDFVLFLTATKYFVWSHGGYITEDDGFVL